MDLEKYARQVQQSPQGAALEKLTRSEAGAKLAASLDGEKLEKAAKAGDMQALSQILKGVLSTPEGKSFARQVEKAVKRDGQ